MDALDAMLDMSRLAPVLVGATVGGVLVLAVMVVLRFPDLAVLDVRLGPFQLRMINKVGKREE